MAWDKNKNDIITAADINDLITRTNAECVRRAVTWSKPLVVPGVTVVDSQLGKDIEVIRRQLNTVHSLPRTGKVAGTPGSSPAGWNGADLSSNLVANEFLTSSTINVINDDITRLAAQCGCNTYKATINSTVCKTHCNPNCANGCGYVVTCCNSQGCSQCWLISCCNGQACVQSICSNGCNCNGEGCYTNCTCNQNCGCEFN